MDTDMADEAGFGAAQEEIQGAPPVVSRAELRERRVSEVVTVNRYLYQQSQQLEHMLLGAPDLQAMLEILLVSMPRHFSFRVSELWLFDPEDILSQLIVGGERYGEQLQLMHDVYPMQELYELEPDIVLVDATDSRMFEVLKSEQGIEYALLMPLLDSGRMIGSLHMGLQDDSLVLDVAEEALLAHLASFISACFKAAVNRQQISQLTLLDPLTQISNLRGFQKDISREIARARRAKQPIAILLMEIDDFEGLYDSHGNRRGQFVVKKVAERLSSDLRATDMLARLARHQFAVLIPGADEKLGLEIAERMRADIEEFSIDDGRGAVLQVTLSVGLVAWEPQEGSPVDMPQLAQEIEAVATTALDAAKASGGNSIAQSSLNQ